MVYDQLVKHVGMEGRGGAAGGGALVINTSTVTANPINRLLAAPVTQNWLTVRITASYIIHQLHFSTCMVLAGH